MKKWALVLAMGSLFVTACSQNNRNNSMGDTGESIAGNIVGGSASSAKFQKDNGLVALMLLGEDSEGNSSTSICTGSLITSNIVLSAAHCVLSSPDSTLKQVLVIFTNDIETAVEEIKNQNFEHVRAVDRVARHNELDFDQNAGMLKNDVALLRFKGTAPADFKLAKVATTTVFNKLKVGVNLSYSGYGVTSYVMDPTTQKAKGEGSGVLRSIDNRKIIQITADKSKLIFSQTDNKGACHGDSGGPAYFIDSTGQRYIVGVTSQGFWSDAKDIGKTDPLCNQLNIYTNLEIQQEWIATNMAKLQQAQ